jgi:hypothetical protein
MLKKTASFVLASSRSSTGTQPPHHSAARTDVVLLIRRTVRPRGYASGASIGCGLADGLFEHPAGVLISYPRHADYRCSVMPELFFRGLLGTIAERRSCWSRLPAAARRTATSESCRLFLSNGVIGAPLMPRAFAAKRRGCGCWSRRSVSKIATACLSDVAASAWATAARTDGSGCLAKSAASETADRSPSRSSPSTTLARTCILASRVSARNKGILSRTPSRPRLMAATARTRVLSSPKAWVNGATPPTCP